MSLAVGLWLGGVSPAADATPSEQSPRIVFVGYPGGTNGQASWFYSIRIDGTGLQRIDHVSGWDPAVSPDGTRIAFTYGGGIGVVGVNGKHLHHLDGGRGDMAQGPAWSADGTKIAFTRAGAAVGRRSGVWTMSPDGRSKRFLSLAPIGATVPIKVERFDARHFVIPTGSPVRFAVIDARSGHVERWITPPTRATAVPPAVSPATHELAYSQCDTSNCSSVSVTVITLQGKLVQTIPGADFPAWTSTGELLYMLNERIMLARSGGSGARAITPASLPAEDPAWQG